MAAIFNSPSKYIQGPDELAKLGSYVEPLGAKALVIVTHVYKRQAFVIMKEHFFMVDVIGMAMILLAVLLISLKDFKMCIRDRCNWNATLTSFFIPLLIP